jgi:hypothetical protein
LATTSAFVPAFISAAAGEALYQTLDAGKRAFSRRAGNWRMIHARSASLIADQRAISWRVRPQPAHRLVAGSIVQTLMQGVSIIGDEASAAAKS